jgi:hypothetical protein
LKYFQARLEPTTGLKSNGGLLALPENIRHRWKLMVANALAYSDMATIMAVRSFILKPPG